MHECKHKHKHKQITCPYTYTLLLLLCCYKRTQINKLTHTHSSDSCLMQISIQTQTQTQSQLRLSHSLNHKCTHLNTLPPTANCRRQHNSQNQLPLTSIPSSSACHQVWQSHSSYFKYDAPIHIHRRTLIATTDNSYCRAQPPNGASQSLWHVLANSNGGVVMDDGSLNTKGCNISPNRTRKQHSSFSSHI